jgi:hypothetical protein
VLALGLAGGLGFWFISKNKPKPVAGSKSNKSTTEAKSKKQSKTEVLAGEALALRPWYQKKRFAFPAIGALAFSLFAIALGLLLPAQESNTSVKPKRVRSNDASKAGGKSPRQTVRAPAVKSKSKSKTV